MDRGAWEAAVHGVAKSDMTEQLHFHFSLSCIGEENGNQLQCSCLENPRDKGAWWAAVHGVAQSWTQLQRLSSSRRKHAVSPIGLSVLMKGRADPFLFMDWRRKWQPTPVFLPGESQGRGSLVGYRLWGRTESDTTEAT